MRGMRNREVSKKIYVMNRKIVLYRADIICRNDKVSISKFRANSDEPNWPLIYRVIFY